MFKVSNHSLSNVAACTFRGYLSKVQGLAMRPEHLDSFTSHQAEAGKATHAARLHYLETFDLSASLSLFSSHYQNYSNTNIGAISQYSHSNLSQLLSHFLPQSPLHLSHELWTAPNGAPATELTLTHPLTPDILYEGRLDAVLSERATGAICPYDFKLRVKNSPWWWNQWPLSTQLMGYTWLLRMTQSSEIYTIGSAIIEMLESTLLQPPTVKCRTHKTTYDVCSKYHVVHEKHDYTYTNASLTSWLALATHYAKKLKALQDIPLSRSHTIPREGPFRDSCIFCDYRLLCRANPASSQLMDWLQPAVRDDSPIEKDS